MNVVDTDRLRLRWASAEDAGFILELVTDPSWTENIGKSSVSNLNEAERYIERAMNAMYVSEGFGLYVVELKSNGEPVGICGLIRRDTLEDVDLGFAMLPRHCRRGYSFEAASATLGLAKQEFGLSRVVAITSKANQPSIKLLEKLGFAYESMVRPGDTGDELMLFGMAV